MRWWFYTILHTRLIAAYAFSMEDDAKRHEDFLTPSASGEALEKDPVFLGPLIGVVMVLLVIALAGLFLWGSARASAEAHREGLLAKPFVQQ